MSKIIGICNQKGGTGKTTTAINVSAFLGLLKKKTLLIDMDPQGNATSGVGKEATEDTPTIYEVLIGEKLISEVIQKIPYPNLYLIPASVSLTGAEIELVNRDDRESILKQKLSLIQDKFEYIIIDAPPSLGLLTINVLSAIHTLIIPIQCEYYALEGLSKLLNTIELVKESLNPNLTIEGILLTMADFRTKLTLQVVEEVKKYFPQLAFNTIVARNVKLAEAPSFGKPIFFYDPHCVGSIAYFSLVKEILKEDIDFSDIEKKDDLKKEWIWKEVF